MTQVGADGFLDLDSWARAVERVRLTHFADLSASTGAGAVGGFLALQYFNTAQGNLVREALSVMSLERAMVAVALPMADRLRRNAQFDFRPGIGGGGLIEIRGEVVVSAFTLVGFFQELVAVIPGRHEVRLWAQERQLITLEVTLRP